MDVNLSAVLEDHFDLETAAPFVFDDTTLEQTASAGDARNAFAAGRKTNGHIDVTVTARIGHLQNGFGRRAANARACLFDEQAMRLVPETRFVAAWFWWYGSAARRLYRLRSLRRAGGCQQDHSGEKDR